MMHQEGDEDVGGDDRGVVVHGVEELVGEEGEGRFFISGDQVGITSSDARPMLADEILEEVEIDLHYEQDLEESSSSGHEGLITSDVVLEVFDVRCC